MGAVPPERLQEEPPHVVVFAASPAREAVEAGRIALQLVHEVAG